MGSYCLYTLVTRLLRFLLLGGLKYSLNFSNKTFVLGS